MEVGDLGPVCQGVSQTGLSSVPWEPATERSISPQCSGGGAKTPKPQYIVLPGRTTSASAKSCMTITSVHIDTSQGLT